MIDAPSWSKIDFLPLPSANMLLIVDACSVPSAAANWFGRSPGCGPPFTRKPWFFCSAMKCFALAFGFAGIAFSATQVFAAVLPMDAPVKMGAVTAVCSGVGSDKDSNQYADYPIKLEFSNSGAQFVSNEHVKLMNDTGA